MRSLEILNILFVEWEEGVVKIVRLDYCEENLIQLFITYLDLAFVLDGVW